jgi:hypothetical protein
MTIEFHPSVKTEGAVVIGCRAVLGRSFNVLNFDFKAAQPLGQQVVKRRENDEENETENAGKYRPQKVNNSDDSELLVAEDNHRDADESVHKAHQDIEGGHHLAGLQNGDAD